MFVCGHICTYSSTGTIKKDIWLIHCYSWLRVYQYAEHCSHLKSILFHQNLFWISYQTALNCLLICLCCVPSSQSLSTLSVIEDFLSKRPMPTGIASPDSQGQNWVRNLNYYSESSNLYFYKPAILQTGWSSPLKPQSCDSFYWFSIRGCNFQVLPFDHLSWQMYTVLWKV